MKKVILACLAMAPAICGAVSDDACKTMMYAVETVMAENDYKLALDLCRVMHRHPEVSATWQYRFMQAKSDICQSWGKHHGYRKYAKRAKHRLPKVDSDIERSRAADEMGADR